ncbi:hypothetical protein JCM10449v2_003534 [Rhodotorula kratochvilovae]
MPSTVTPQPCEIRGKETTQRCSACAITGVDLFFCSTEHQKLVWRAHKRNCGPGKANPFFIPPLTDEELASVQERADRTIITPQMRRTTLAAELAAVSGRPFSYVYEHLGGSVTDTKHLRKKAFLVNIARSTRWADPSRPDVLTTDTVLWSFISPSRWFTPLHHKLLLLAGLTTRGAFEGDPEALEWLPAVRERMTAWVRAGMGTGDLRTRALLADVKFEFAAYSNCPGFVVQRW